MLALIDADVLRYEIGSIGENNGPDSTDPMWFDRVADYLNQRISTIQFATEADEVCLYLTGDSNFRDEIAVTKPYKGNRKASKPFHFENLTAYMYNRYDVVTMEGLEADDVMAVTQLNNLGETVICTRDKDLRMIPGWHYGWECGAQRELHMHWVDHDGGMYLDEKGKLRANGMALFYAQLLTGDTVDNIPGLPGVGDKRAFDMLAGLKPEEMFPAVHEAYLNKGMTDEYLLEQGRLLWMTRELTEDLRPVLWQFPS